MPLDKEAIRASFESGLPIHFRSCRSSIILEVDVKMLESIFHAKASTKTMNLFMIWMENTLPQVILDKVWFMDGLWYGFVTPRCKEDVGAIKNHLQGLDMSRHCLLFLPIIHRITNFHWRHMVFYTSIRCRISMQQSIFLVSIGFLRSSLTVV